MPSLVNRLVVSELERDLGKVQGALFMSFGGLTVKEVEYLRGKMAEKGVRVRMIRNSLARSVLAARGLEFAPDVLSGNTAVAWGDAEAAIHAAKVAVDPDVKKHGKVRVRAGILDGQWLGGQDAAALAEIPDKKTLQAKLLSCISGPARGLVASLNALPSGIPRMIRLRGESLPPEAGAPEAPPAVAPAT
jgi:large subunit ribosomal protein L10